MYNAMYTFIYSEHFISTTTTSYCRKFQRGNLSAMGSAETEVFLYKEEEEIGIRFRDPSVPSNIHIF